MSLESDQPTGLRSETAMDVPRWRPRALLLDRDGTLISETGYLKEDEPYDWIPGAREAVARAQAGGLGIAVVTNQSAVARGWLSLDGLARIHGRMTADLVEVGAQPFEWHSCPHHPDFAAPGTPACDCRKPEPGLLLRAARNLSVDPEDCWMVGDSWRDLDSGRRAGAVPVFVLTGKGPGQWRESLQKDGVPPLSAPDLGAVVDWALGLPPRAEFARA